MSLTEKEREARSKLCLPLDGLSSMEELNGRVNELSEVVGLFKVGKESYTRFGPAAVEAVHNAGAQVFLDLKYHDIPNTVEGAAKVAADLGVYMFNVHASGGVKMMEAAMQGVHASSHTPKVVAVTVLTSIDDDIMNFQLRVPGRVEEQVLNYARLSQEAGLDGVVCSAADLHSIKDKLPSDFMYVTPGIKGTTTPAGEDQKRTFSPGNAIQDGASILVVGRAITAGKTPEERLQSGYEILRDMATRL